MSFEELLGERSGFQCWVRLLIFFIPDVYSQLVVADTTVTILSIASPLEPYMDAGDVVAFLSEDICPWSGTQQD